MEKNFLKIINALNDPTRLKIIYILSKGNLCPIHLEKIINVSQTNISRHSQKLINAEILEGTKKGRRTIYNLNPEFIKHYSDIIGKLEVIYEQEIDSFLLKKSKEECEAMK